MRSNRTQSERRTVRRCTLSTIGCAATSAALLALLAGAAHASPAKLYTKGQARQGATIYAQHCVSCHGNNEQGKSGPAIAGNVFLKRTKLLGWSVANFRHVVVTTMPRSNPGSLSDKQYADVIAYLLSVDCYPAGKSEFPTKTTAQLEHTQMQKPRDVTPDNEKIGTCTLSANG